MIPILNSEKTTLIWIIRLLPCCKKISGFRVITNTQAPPRTTIKTMLTNPAAKPTKAEKNNYFPRKKVKKRKGRSRK